MSDDLIIRKQALIENPTPRVPICFVLDASGSMSEVIEGNYTSTGQTVEKDGKYWDIVSGGVTRLDKLNDGVKVFFDVLNKDEIARYAAEISIVAFAGNAEVILDFMPLPNMPEHISIEEADIDGTHIGTGVALALEILDKRKNEYKEAGVDYFQPWIVLMTDGRPTSGDPYVEVSKIVKDRVNKKTLTIIPIGVGDEAGMDTLAMFSPKRSPLKLKGLCFEEFFEWLGKSVAATSQSTPGEDVPLDVEGIKGWAVL